jgi:GTP cyclohydrolase IA
MEALIRQLLVSLGEDADREGLVKTPARVARAMSFLTSGYSANVDDILNGALFSVDYSQRRLQ